MAKSSALSLHRRSGSRSCSLRDLRKRQTVIRHRADASHVRGYFSGFPFGVAGGAGLDLPDPRNMRAQPDIAGLAVEPFMPILLHIEARQVDRRLHPANPLGARDSPGAAAKEGGVGKN